MVQIGDAIDDIALPGSDGAVVRLSDVLKERKAVVLVFYLFDFSGG